jgi:hypothetical protein
MHVPLSISMITIEEGTRVPFSISMTTQLRRAHVRLFLFL